ncbi:Signal transduction histidine kinase [Klebsormidium nitens]|uniref:Signal transduction histidine kinase n=1 Tax=Klebsormidium nitens TaxID=105231 RepID=A0A1Y1HL79_KLENI|nr:Signal transduction histidine kinase [Klebsormidium nitens]|eukprot:GAQ79364.1 Signal transduction histidine kinase [Klebsormidium nitens]
MKKKAGTFGCVWEPRRILQWLTPAKKWRGKGASMYASGEEEDELPRSYSVLLMRLATMALLTVLLAGVAMMAFFFTHTASVKTIDILGKDIRADLLARTGDQLRALLETQSLCSTSLANALVDELSDAAAWDSAAFERMGRRLSIGSFVQYNEVMTGVGYCMTDGVGSYSLAGDASKPLGASPTFSTFFSNTSSARNVAPPSYFAIIDTATRHPVQLFRGFSNADCRAIQSFDFDAVMWDPSGSVLNLIPEALTGFPNLVRGSRFEYTGPRVGTHRGLATCLISLTTVSDFLAGLDLNKGTIYVTNGSVLMASSAGADAPSGGVSQFVIPEQSSIPIIRATAAFLRSVGSAGTTDNAAVDAVASFADVRLLGAEHFVQTQSFSYRGMRVTVVMAHPRRSLMGAVDRTATRTIVAVATCTAAVGLLGVFMVFLLTSPISNEIKLERELFRQLAAKRRAEAMSETKSRFMANMSHELRTPMASILGLLDLLLDDSLAPPQTRAVLQIRDCAASLLVILNDILDFSKVEAGKMDLESVPFDLIETLEDLVELMTVQSAQQGVELALDLPDTLGHTIGDPVRVRQIFTNLLSNAIKFTREGYVVIRGRPDGTRAGWLVFEVEDTGCGIPKTHVQSVFEAFVQVDLSTTRVYGGTGLGLTIVKSLVELMGGTITIEDKVGPGTLFRIRLCLEKETGPSNRTPFSGTSPGKTTSQLSDAQQNQSTDQNLGSLSTVHGNATPKRLVPFPGARALLLVRGAVGASLAARTLEEVGWTSLAVDSWEGALAALNRSEPTLAPGHQPDPEAFSPRKRSSLEDAHPFMSSDVEFSTSALATRISGESSRRGAFALILLDYALLPPGSDGVPDAPRGLAELRRALSGGSNAGDAETEKSSGERVAPTDRHAPSEQQPGSTEVSDLPRELLDTGAPRIVWLVDADVHESVRQALRTSVVGALVVQKPLFRSGVRRALQELVATCRAEEGSCPRGEAVSPLRTSAGISVAPEPPLADEPAVNLLLVTRDTNFRPDAFLVASSPRDAQPTAPETFEAPANSLKPEPELRSAALPVLERLGIEEKAGSKNGSPKNGSPRGRLSPEAQLAVDTFKSKGFRALVVEDTPVLRQLAQSILGKLNVRVTAVENGLLAVDAVVAANVDRSDGAQPFDFILMDCQMPVMDGYAAVRAIRAAEHERGIPREQRARILALTAHALVEDEAKCLAAGMDYYLTKPLNIGKLAVAVAQELPGT